MRHGHAIYPALTLMHCDTPVLSNQASSIRLLLVLLRNRVRDLPMISLD